MGSVNRRVGVALSGLVLLFVAVVTVQLAITDRLQGAHDGHTARIDRIRAANEAVLQNMTDAETGVRGFQLTGEQDFLQPYDSGRVGAFTAFDAVAAGTRDAEVQRLLVAERSAASHWLYAYAIPIVLAGVADADMARAGRGKEMFGQFRTANAAVGRAVAAEGERVAAADQQESRLAQLLFAALDVAFVAVALLLFEVGRRRLLGPLEHIRLTLQRLAAGDRSARAVAGGPAEMRAVIGTLNRLADETERMLAAEQARSRSNELRQAVVSELQNSPDAEVTAERIAALIGEALRADAVYSRVTVVPGHTVTVDWPAGTPALPGPAAQEVVAGRPGAVRSVELVPGAVAVALGADGDCPAGLICLVRHDGDPWQPDECDLLGGLGREIDRAVRQTRLQHRQARLISELRVLDERRDAFVATVTHELRTPLTSILGYTELLADGDGGELTAMQQRGAAAILRNALRLQDTVGDLLLLDRAGSRIGAAYTTVDLAGIAAAAAAEPAGAARAKQIALVVACDGPVWVSGDAGQLHRALHNLLDNAIKFTPAGGRIELRVGPGDGRAVLTVTDTGIGIPAGDLPGLGTPFHRAVNAMDQAVQGSGLGLAIVHNIVGEHGGVITVDSEVDRGSTFTVLLPVAAGPGDLVSATGRPADPARSGPG